MNIHFSPKLKLKAYESISKNSAKIIKEPINFFFGKDCKELQVNINNYAMESGRNT